MVKLHEILAIESCKEGYFKSTLTDITNLFKNKANHFSGFNKCLTLYGDETPEKIAKEKSEATSQALTSTVKKELQYLAEVVTSYVDVVYKKDDANRRAIADIVVNGVTIAVGVPVTTLLGLENKLKQLRPIYDQIPTLLPGTSWEIAPSLGEGVYIDKDQQILAKTRKGFAFKEVSPATDKFPAQVEKWETVEDIGFTTLTRWTGMLSVADKVELLKRFDAVNHAVKQARQRANDVEVHSVNIGKVLMDTINSF